MVPADFRYTKEHEWIKIDGATGTIGITDYAQNCLLYTSPSPRDA